MNKVSIYNNFLLDSSDSANVRLIKEADDLSREKVRAILKRTYVSCPPKHNIINMIGVDGSKQYTIFKDLADSKIYIIDYVEGEVYN